MLYDKGEYFFSKQYKMHIVDRVGGGDSFGGGLIYAPRCRDMSLSRSLSLQRLLPAKAYH